MSKVQYYLRLPHGQPGDDLAYYLKRSRAKSKELKQAKALRGQADDLECAAAMLRHTAILVQSGKLVVDQADGNYITILADNSVGDELVKGGLLDRMEGDKPEKTPVLKSVH